MARSPRELLTKLNAERKHQAGELEKRIDTWLDKEFKGCELTLTVDAEVHPAVIGELRLRYKDWSITVRGNKGSSQKDGDWCFTYLTFRPTGSSSAYE